MRLLIIEDENWLAESLKTGLEEAGYVVDVASDGVEGEEMALENTYDALIVDWRLPRRDGRQVIERLRAQGQHEPILMLTALGDVEHRIEGLDAGADDYLPKPFKFEELLARIRALLRRRPMVGGGETVKVGAVELDRRKRRVLVGDRPLELRPKEFVLLDELLLHPDEVLSRTVIAERVWGDIYMVSDNVIDVTISGLRKKLEEAQAISGGNPVVRIETLRGVGYRLAADPNEEDGPVS